MNITAAAICKNEEILIKPWIEHILNIPQFKEIVIIDTGSTDKTLDYIAEYEKSKKVFCHTMEWQNNFSAARDMALKKAREHDSEWCIMFDIDEFFNSNKLKFFESLDPGGCDIIQLFHIKFWKFNQAYFRSPPALSTYNNGNIIYSNDKATLRIFKKDLVTSFGSPLHEHPIYSRTPITKAASLINSQVIPEEDLINDFFVIHYDMAKLHEQAKRYDSSIDVEVGKKRLVYRKIQSAHANGVSYTTEWANGDVSEQELAELGSNQIKQSLEIDGHIFPKLKTQDEKLNCKELNKYLNE